MARPTYQDVVTLSANQRVITSASNQQIVIADLCAVPTAGRVDCRSMIGIHDNARRISPRIYMDRACVECLIAQAICNFRMLLTQVRKQAQTRWVQRLHKGLHIAPPFQQGCIVPIRLRNQVTLPRISIDIHTPASFVTIDALAMLLIHLVSRQRLVACDVIWIAVEAKEFGLHYTTLTKTRFSSSIASPGVVAHLKPGFGAISSRYSISKWLHVGIIRTCTTVVDERHKRRALLRHWHVQGIDRALVLRHGCS
ncbi:hypothetical protein ST33_13100 [Xanthomonas citri pv. fuscans]|nr:hypothetical protein ST33_13100 [Xanthomonas citri pv. fuscans]